MQKLSLDYFNLPEGRKYHLYRIDSSQVSQQPHSHEFYQICYVECGHIEHWLDDTPVTVGPGSAFIVPPGCVHRILFPEKNVFLYSLSFDETMFHAGFSHSNVYHFMTALKLDSLESQRIPIRSKVYLDTPRQQTLQALMEALLREQESTCPAELTAAASLVASILCVLSQGYFLDETGQERLQAVTRYSRSMEACLSYINTHFTEAMDLESLSHQFGLSRSNFSLLFPQYAGMTLKRYIAQKRIDYAIALLQTTGLPIHEIARMAGFEDFSTFSRNFSKIAGTPPSAFRRSEE